jgi:hypothetical protein
VWAYRAGPLRVAANLTDQEVTLPGLGEVLLATGPAAGATLGPWQGVVTRAR